MLGVALGNYGSADWRVPTLMTGIGGLILFVSATLFFIEVIMSAYFSKEKAEVEMPVAEPLHAEVIPAWLNNWQPWLVGTVVLIVVAYAPMLIQLISQAQFTSPGFKVW